MNNFMLGIILGSMLTGGLVGAANFYDAKGTPNAPTGTVQQYDYFRARQFFLDAAATRRATEAMAADHNRANPWAPCAK